MFPTVLPLRAFLLQFLILWLTIATESWFFQRLLKISPKTSVEYAAVINLFCTCLGWLIFFVWHSFISDYQLKLLLGYVLLGEYNPIYLPLVLAALIMYFGSFLVKWKGLKTIDVLSQTNSQKFVIPAKLVVRVNLNKGTQKKYQISTQAGVVLIAHSCSHCLILLILYLAINRP
jgi:hypothetical protein